MAADAVTCEVCETILKTKCEIMDGYCKSCRMDEERMLEYERYCYPNSNSFAIHLSAISPIQLAAIHSHNSIAHKIGMVCGPKDAWNISDDGEYLQGYTQCDNFDMHAFLNAIGIPDTVIHWE